MNRGGGLHFLCGMANATLGASVSTSICVTKNTRRFCTLSCLLSQPKRGHKRLHPLDSWRNVTLQGPFKATLFPMHLTIMLSPSKINPPQSAVKNNIAFQTHCITLKLFPVPLNFRFRRLVCKAVGREHGAVHLWDPDPHLCRSEV